MCFQRLMPDCHVRAAYAERVHGLRQFCEHHLWRENVHPRGRQFDGQRQSIQSHAHLRHCACVRGCELPARAEDLNSFDEQLNRFDLPQQIEGRKRAQVRRPSGATSYCRSVAVRNARGWSPGHAPADMPRAAR